MEFASRMVVGRLPVVVYLVCLFVTRGLAGCQSSSTQGTVDVSVDVDSTLALTTVVLQATASTGKQISRNFAPATSLHWTVNVSNPTRGETVTVSAEGVMNDASGKGKTIVSYTVLATIGPGETTPVHLRLDASCSPGPVCPSDQNCEQGVCRDRPLFGMPDAGSVDATHGSGGGMGTGGMATGTGGVTGTGGAAPGGGGAGTAGAGMGGATTGTGGAAGTPGSGGGGGAVATPPGSACLKTTDCASGVCLDNVCCDKPCGGCNACSQMFTGKVDGTCAPVSSGIDPHDNCADATATNQCGNDGMCDGAGACRKVGTSHQCTPASCSGSMFTPASNCDGIGACQTVIPVSCGAATCGVPEGCKKTCLTPADCGSQSYCNTTIGMCAATKTDGAVCAAGAECTSGNCIDGVCCHTTCTGCSACSMALTGQASGQCLPIVAGKVAHNACTVSGTTCGQDGTCDGNGGCRFGAHGVSCGSVCSGSSLAPKTCDGVGGCITGTGAPCPSSLICASTTICKVNCSANSDCTTMNCTGVTCGSTKMAMGGLCGATSECVAGLTCVDGVCCGSTSCPACKACNIPGFAGSCANKPANTADAACAATVTNCMTGTCNASGACNPAAAGTSCGADVCTNGAENASAPGQYTSPTFQKRVCDGMNPGAAGCKLGNNQGCLGNVTCASATACRMSCMRDADCIAGNYCSGTFTCAARVDYNFNCTAHNQCKSRVCNTVTQKCVDCSSDDDCPTANGTPVCCGGLCTVVGVCDDYFPDADGKLNCTSTGLCGTRHSVCNPNPLHAGSGLCSCSSTGGSEVDCPIGTICRPGNPPVCLVNGGQPCVTSSECLSGTCDSTTGKCGTSAQNALCASDDSSLGRPTGCGSNTSCVPSGGNLLPYSVCQ